LFSGEGRNFDTHAHTPKMPLKPKEKKHRIWMGNYFIMSKYIDNPSNNPRSCFLRVVWNFLWFGTKQLPERSGHTNPEPIRSLCLKFAKNNIQKCQKIRVFSEIPKVFSHKNRRMGPSGAQALSELALFFSPTIRYPWWKAQGCYLADTKKLKLAGCFSFDFSQGVDTSKGHDQMIKRGWLVNGLKKMGVLYI